MIFLDFLGYSLFFCDAKMLFSAIFRVFHFVLNFCEFSMFSVSRKTCHSSTCIVLMYERCKGCVLLKFIFRRPLLLTAHSCTLYGWGPELTLGLQFESNGWQHSTWDGIQGLGSPLYILWLEHRYFQDQPTFLFQYLGHKVHVFQNVH